MKQQVLLAAVFISLITACTGGKNSLPEEAGFVLQIGTKITVDVSDVVALGQLDSATISIKSVSPDFTSSKLILDLTETIQHDVNGTNQHSIVLPKSIQSARPLLITVDMPQLGTQLIEVLFDGVSETKPGIASTLSYELLKNYPGKLLTDYNGAQFVGIKSLIQTKINQLLAESENLSMESTRYDRLMRYFRNGLAFNINFLNAVQPFGVVYQWTATTPAGVLASDTPEGSLANYQLASSFKVNGVSTVNPFGHTNNPARLLPGSASINPGSGLYIQENKQVTLTAQAFDIDDDFLDKNFIVQYIPRVLPSSVAGSLIKTEPTPEYSVITNLSAPDKSDTYTSATIAYNEALDLNYYIIDGDTAYRNVYYMISDGSVRIPYRWNFKYVDLNRQPQILTNSQNGINDTYFDSTIANGEPSIPAGWQVHASHCETDGNLSYMDSGGNTIIGYQAVHSRADGPWSCAFKVIDPDLDDDPNAAPDTFSYTVAQIDNFTEVRTNGTYVWPALSPYTALDPNKVAGTVVPTCTDAQGKVHQKCGVGLYQVTVDNAVKVAAEAKADQSFNFDVLVYDRVGQGMSTQHTVTRSIQFFPIPPRLVNFSSPTPPPATAPLTQVTADTNGYKSYTRSDVYLSEVLTQADPGGSLSGLTDIGLDSILAGDSNRNAFMSGSPQQISEYVTEPRSLSGTYVVFDPVTSAPIDGGAGTINMYGHSLTTNDVSTYSAPREYDSTCNLNSNNFNIAEGWDQRAPGALAVNPTQTGGWVFEIDAFDLDNVGLRPGEPTDKVYFKTTSDIATLIYGGKGLLEFCGFTQPNSDVLTYQTYSATSTAAAINPDTCTWQSNLPNEMQPIPVFYKVVEGGVTKIKKLVYHRLRVKWKPKDQGLVNKSGLDPQGYIKNLLGTVTLNGNRFLFPKDAQDRSFTLDQTKLSSPIQLVAQRHNMQPCTVGMTRGYDYIHQQNQAPAPTYFSVQDENKVLTDFPYYAGAIMGRYQANLRVQGTRSITDPQILKWVPFMENCTSEDTADPVGPTPAPPPTALVSEPMIFYSLASDATNKPNTRLTSITNPIAPVNSTTNGNFCIQSHFAPVQQTGSSYKAVVVVQNFNSTSSFILPLNSSCFSRSSLLVYPEQKYIVLASRCTGYTLGQVLWSDANSSGTVSYILDAASLGFPATTPVTLKLFPELYQADTSTNKDSANSLFFDVQPMDNYILGASGFSEYTGYTTFVPALPSNVGPTPTPPNIAPTDFSFLTQYIDWDNGGPGSSMYLTLATPTPDPASSNVFFRTAPGDITRIQVFSKNRSAVTFPVRSSDVASTTVVELDPYDVHTFAFGTPPVPAPANNPTLNRPWNGAQPCNDAPTVPAAYPALSTLVYSSLLPYRTCQFSWSPNAGGSDDGKKFSYMLNVEDNFGGNPAMGVGARHPAANALSKILGDSNPITNGPTSSFYIDIEALEPNTPPFWTSTLNGAQINQSYLQSGGAAGWTTVFSPTGIQPTCASAQTGYPCPSSANPIKDGDILMNTTPIVMDELKTQSFVFYAKDSNITPELKTLTALPPTWVLIVDGSHSGRVYFPPSLSSISNLSPIQNLANGTVQLSFNWTPTDTEANQVSNSGGFLIPITVTDQQYKAAADPAFPTQFITAAKTSTIWIWAKVNVKNQTPSVYVVNSSNVETLLNGATVQFQSNVMTSYKIRVKDNDIARIQKNGETSGFIPSLSVPPFVSVSAAGAPYIQGTQLYQDMVFTATPTNSDLGTYTSPSLLVTDPGDPSLGLALNPDAGTPPRSRITSSSDSFTTPFTIQVIGRPVFLVPNATQNQVTAYSNQPFRYPLSLSISRPTEMGAAMFVGIDSATTVTPVKRATSGATSTGLYVTETFVLEWSNPLFTDITTPAGRTIPLYGISASYCNPGLSSPSKTLIRYNKTTSLMETCKLSAADVTNNLSTAQNLTVTLINGGGMPTPAPISQAQVSRYMTPTPTPANALVALDQQFADFKGRCGATCGVSPITSNTSPSNLSLNPSANTGWAEYTSSNYRARYDFDISSGFSVTKTYSDLAPAAGRSISAMAFKNEPLTFNATLGFVPGTPYLNYRWYVNGCLRDSGQVTSSSVSYSLLTKNDMSGLNNDCTGQYGFNETSAGVLGKLIVRLSIVNGSEAATTTGDSATSTYVWSLDIVNSDPSIQTNPTVTKSAPLTLNGVPAASPFYTGTQNSIFAMPVTYGGKSYFAYSDYAGAAGGLKIRLREISSTGGLLTNSGYMNLTCDATFSAQPTWMGIQPQANGKLLIAASNVTNPYPTGSGANLVYGASTKTCYQNTLSLATPNLNYINLGSASSVPAGYLAFSKFRQWTKPIAAFTNSSSNYDGTNDANYFLIHSTTSSSQFWTYTMQNVYSSTPTELTSPYVNNTVRKTIVSGTKMFHLIGASANNLSGWRGAILIDTVAPNGAVTTKTDATIQKRIAFAGPASLPAPSPNDCQFDGTPLDGVYDSGTDILYVLAASNDGTGKGHFVKITSITTSPTCTKIGDTMNPSMDTTDYVEGTSKMSFDTAHGLVFGLVNGVGTTPGQIYALDIFTQKLTVRDISASILPSSVIYSPETNALLIYDNRRAGATYPTLYRVW